MTNPIDRKYYQVISGGSVSERLLIRARDRIYRDFLRTMAPTRDATIVDVGVSDVINDGANFLERLYPHRANIVACGLSEASEFRRHFPECAYRKIDPNVRLPFADDSFDIATSNAVLEHVGSESDQAFHIQELCRVASRVFISVPHRFFPVEHHTSIPVLHYTDHLFRLACVLSRKEEWLDRKNLILMTRSRLRRLVTNTKRHVDIGFTGLRLGPLSSNLYLSLT